MVHSEEINFNDYDLSKGSRLQRKQDRRDFKKEKRGTRIERLKATAQNRRSKAESRVILAEQGVVQGSGIGDYVKAATNLVGAATGASTQQDVPPTFIQKAQATVRSMSQVADDVSNVFNNAGGGVQTPPYVADYEKDGAGVTDNNAMPDKDGIKKYMPLIIAGILVVVVIVAVMLTKKNK